MADYDSLHQKYEISEQEKQNGDAATSLLRQFIDAGLISQNDDGTFVAPNDNEDRKFQPMAN